MLLATQMIANKFLYDDIYKNLIWEKVTELPK